MFAYKSPTFQPHHATARVDLSIFVSSTYAELWGALHNSAYLLWKIREAQKGRIPIGPRKNAHREGVTFKVLAWRARGIKSRTEFFRVALGHYLKELGAEDVAALFANAAGVTV